MKRSRQRMIAALLLIVALVVLAACEDVTSVMEEAGATVEAELPAVAEELSEAVEQELGEPEEAAEAETEEAEHSIYEGDTGPDHWAELYPNCAGAEQSPIDISAPAGSNLEDIVFNYAETPVKIFNNGHTIQVEYAEGSTITLAGVTYPLKQFHFHSPSEHTVNGVQAAAELHLVHAIVDDAGQVVSRAVVSALIDEVEGADNPAFASVWANLPAEVTEAKDAQTIEGAFVNANDLLPAAHTYYTYPGSLTTPPCDQGVTWLLLTDHIQMSPAQIAAFRAIIEGNFRPVQPLNDRQVLEDTN